MAGADGIILQHNTHPIHTQHARQGDSEATRTHTPHETKTRTVRWEASADTARAEAALSPQLARWGVPTTLGHACRLPQQQEQPQTVASPCCLQQLRTLLADEMPQSTKLSPWGGRSGVCALPAGASKKKRKPHHMHAHLRKKSSGNKTVATRGCRTLSRKTQSRLGPHRQLRGGTQGSRVCTHSHNTAHTSPQQEPILVTKTSTHTEQHSTSG